MMMIVVAGAGAGAGADRVNHMYGSPLVRYH